MDYWCGGLLGGDVLGDECFASDDRMEHVRIICDVTNCFTFVVSTNLCALDRRS